MSVSINGFVATVACFSGFVGAFYAGAYIEQLDREAEVSKAEGMCKDKINMMTYLAKGVDGYACFRQNDHTKKISKSLLVIEPQQTEYQE